MMPRRLHAYLEQPACLRGRIRSALSRELSSVGQEQAGRDWVRNGLDWVADVGTQRRPDLLTGRRHLARQNLCSIISTCTIVYITRLDNLVTYS